MKTNGKPQAPHPGARCPRLPAVVRALALSHILLLAGCGQTTSRKPGAHPAAGKTPGAAGRIVIFHAASLSRPFAEVERVFEKEHPGVDVVRESSNSRVAIRKITDLGRNADILASADDFLLRDLMFPQAADWTVLFARNRIVIAFTDRSRGGDEITPNNWYEILLRKDVQFGYANPNMAPVGYRTLLCWKLATKYYAPKLHGRNLFAELRAACPPDNIRPHVNELLPPLESLRLDYVFLYRSVALQHHLKWIKLPDAIDLGDEHRAAEYARANVEIGGRHGLDPIRITGRPITYGITIPKNARNPVGAIAFLEFLFSKRGRKILTANFQEPLSPPLPCYGFANLPAELRKLTKPWNPPGAPPAAKSERTTP